MGCHLACAFAVLVISGEMGNFLFSADPQKKVPCVDSGQTADNKPLLYPQNATPTECAVTGPTDGFRCTIGNYFINYPDACEYVEKSLETTSAPMLSPRLDEVCQPRLTSLNLFRLTCLHHEELSPISLNFSFQLPLCDGNSASEATAIKVDFKANKNHSTNYFLKNPICRLFNYTGSNFSYISNFSEKIVLAYEWMAVGIKDSFPEVYYYLSLMAFPSAAQLNYTIVYLDVSAESMRLVAGAWQSQCTAHFVFLPIDDVKSYRLEAISNGPTRWTHSEVVSGSTFELKNIPVHSNIVTVTVTPNDPDTCKRLNYPCSPIRITLHDKKTLNLPVDPPTSINEQDEGLDWRNAVIIAVGSVVALGLVIATIAVIRHQSRIKGCGEAPAVSRELTPESRKVLIITSLPEGFYEALHILLTNHDFTMDALKNTDQCVNRMRDSKIIFLVIHPHMRNYPEWSTFSHLVLRIFENRPLWMRVRVISLDEQGEVSRLQDLFRGSEGNRPHLNEFWSELGQRTHSLLRPEDEDALVMALNEMFPREGPQVHDNEEYDQAEAGNLGPGVGQERPRRHNQHPFPAVRGDVLAERMHLLAFGEAVPVGEDEGPDLDQRSDAGASSVSGLSGSWAPAEPSNVPTQVEAEVHGHANVEDQHGEARSHLNPVHYHEASDNQIEMRSIGVLPQGFLPDGSSVPSQSQPAVTWGYRPDVEETELKVPLVRNTAGVLGDLTESEETVPKLPHRGDAARMPGDLPESGETVPKIQYGRETQRVPGGLTESEETVPKIPQRGDVAKMPEDLTEWEQTVPKTPLGREDFAEANEEIPLPGKSSGSSVSDGNQGSFKGHLEMTDDSHFLPLLDFLLPSGAPSRTESQEQSQNADQLQHQTSGEMPAPQALTKVHQSDSTGETEMISSPGGRVSVGEGRNDSNSVSNDHSESPDLPALSLLLHSAGSENQEQSVYDEESCLAMPSSAAIPELREILLSGEENSHLSSLGNVTSLSESEASLPGAGQPGYSEHNNDKVRVDQSYHFEADDKETSASNSSLGQGARPRDDRESRARNYFPDKWAGPRNLPEVCGPEKFMSKLSDRADQQGRHRVARQLGDLPAVHRRPGSHQDEREGHRVPVREVRGNEERNQLSGASLVCGPEDHPSFQSVRNSRQGSMARDSGTPERNEPGRTPGRPPRNALERPECDRTDQAAGWKAGVQDRDIHLPLSLNAEESVLPLRQRGDMGATEQHPYPEARRRVEGIRYEGHRDAERGRVFEPLFEVFPGDFEQGPPNHQGLRRDDRPVQREGQYPPNLPFQQIREPVEHDELNDIDGDNNGDSGFQDS